MKRAFKSRSRIILAALAMVWTVGPTIGAQWEPYPWKNVPRLPNGKIDLNAPARRTADGRPDLSGFWMLCVLAGSLRRGRRVAVEGRIRHIPLTGIENRPFIVPIVVRYQFDSKGVCICLAGRSLRPSV